jgi:hypothetical protein
MDRALEGNTDAHLEATHCFHFNGITVADPSLSSTGKKNARTSCRYRHMRWIKDAALQFYFV